MAKPDPASLDPARYPFHCTMATRFGDLDINMHLNNVALVAIMEDGRVRFHHACRFPDAMIADGAASKFSLMVASFAIEYLDQAWYPQALDMHVAVNRVGRTSFGLQQLLIQEGRVVSFAQSVIVCMTDGRPAAVPAAFTADIDGWMLRP